MRQNGKDNKKSWEGGGGRINVENHPSKPHKSEQPRAVQKVKKLKKNERERERESS